MKAVILCGGEGTRLKEETEYKPKPLVEIGGKPIVWHVMKHYAKYGVKEFILCLGFKGQMIKDYFTSLHERMSDFSFDLATKEKKFFNDGLEDWKITFADTGEKSMTGARIARIKKYIGSDEDFFLTYADAVSDVNIDELYKFHKERAKIVTLTGINPSSHLGILEVGEDYVAKSFREKPKVEDVASGGFFVCNRKVFDYLSEDASCVLEEKPLIALANDKQLAVYPHKGFWKSMDTYKEAMHLNKMWEENPPWKTWTG